MKIKNKERQLIFYDFEVFEQDWLVVFQDRDSGKQFTIVNDRELLFKFWNKHKKDVFIGYNSRMYDVNIMKAILLDMNPYIVSNNLIEKEMKGFEAVPSGYKVQLYNFDIATGFHSLKQLEGFTGVNIHETSVDFKIKRKLTESELKDTEMYCKADVRNTAEIFEIRKVEFDSHVLLIETFNLDMKLFNKTKAQLSAEILGAKKKQWDDEFNFSYPDTIRLGKYEYIKQWFENENNKCYSMPIIKNNYLNQLYNNWGKRKFTITRFRPSKTEKKESPYWEITLKEDEVYNNEFINKTLDWIMKQPREYKANTMLANQLKTKIMGVECVIGFGGTHGAVLKYNKSGFFVMSDVASLYPSIMIEYGFLSRNVCNPDKFREIRDTRLKLKAIKDPKQGALKIVINSTFGASKDRFNNLFDPLMANNVCIAGQLLLVDLMEKVENLGFCENINDNTDGIMVRLENESQYDKYIEVCKEWEKRTRLDLEHDIYTKVHQKDVNNYIIIDKDGNSKRKGAFVKKLSKIDYDLPIVNEAVVEYITNNTDIAEYINNCEELIKFQKVVKLTSKFKHCLYNNEIIDGKVFRVFATRDLSKTALTRVNKVDTEFKIANTPDNVEIINDDISELKCPSWLDKQWYIEMAKTRVGMFGVDCTEEQLILEL